MNPLQIIIGKKSFAIHNKLEGRDLVSGITRMDDALEMFRALSHSKTTYRSNRQDGSDWLIAPGILEERGCSVVPGHGTPL